MEESISFVDFFAGGGRCGCGCGCGRPLSPDFVALMAAPPPRRAASPEYEPVSRFWREGSEPSTTLRLGPPRASSTDHTPSSTFRDAMSEGEYTPASPKYTPVSRSWRAGSPYYTRSTPESSEASAEYTPASAGYGPGSPSPSSSAASSEYPSSPTIRAASPDYTPVSTRWRAGSPEYTTSSSREFSPTYTPQTMPPRRAPSPDYSPSTAPPSPVVSDAGSRTSPPPRRYHPYQRSGASTCAMRAGGISRVQRRLPMHGY